jgi:hypothetical protein
VVWDRHRQGLWVLTGDADGECALLFTGDACRTITEVVRGAQTFRACKVFAPEGLYYGTDTERAQLVVYLDIDRGRVHKIRPLPGIVLTQPMTVGIPFPQRWVATITAKPCSVIGGFTPLSERLLEKLVAREWVGNIILHLWILSFVNIPHKAVKNFDLPLYLKISFNFSIKLCIDYDAYHALK